MASLPKCVVKQIKPLSPPPLNLLLVVDTVVYSSNCHLIRVVQAVGQWRYQKLVRRINQQEGQQLVQLGEFTYIKIAKIGGKKLRSLTFFWQLSHTGTLVGPNVLGNAKTRLLI